MFTSNIPLNLLRFIVHCFHRQHLGIQYKIICTSHYHKISWSLYSSAKKISHLTYCFSTLLNLLNSNPYSIFQSVSQYICNFNFILLLNSPSPYDLIVSVQHVDNSFFTPDFLVWHHEHPHLTIASVSHLNTP